MRAYARRNLEIQKKKTHIDSDTTLIHFPGAQLWNGAHHVNGLSRLRFFAFYAKLKHGCHGATAMRTATLRYCLNAAVLLVFTHCFMVLHVVGVDMARLSWQFVGRPAKLCVLLSRSSPCNSVTKGHTTRILMNMFCLEVNVVQ